MFGLSVEHLLILLVAALFILGPERLPEATRWLAQAVRKVREFAAGAREEVRAGIGPELDELRKPLEDLRSLRDFDPKTALDRYLTADAPAAPAGSVRSGRSPVDPDAT
ncbi:twin-arginine translocase TatA/TatE family subunit [Amycolatopsis sp. CA-230715]|uniref:twin-arginine translocase TatA/TatE family subunit n=1 Tax=Amycolatopsis sp. CA-230715 TaxID=2745196 RepID=UPI001C02DDD0|nr:twin-arginine translocase TatA/TatE family subunit [Amycolatopsis sp. CA-230715]QWF76662.1 Sec-independent protein translocase protein TatB [Amycolatopsis sp. CA-230715]